MAAAPGPVHKQLTSLNCTLIQCRTHRQSEFYLYHKRLSKANQPEQSSRWWPRICNRKFRRVLYNSSRTDAKTPVQNVVWLGNEEQRIADPNHTVERQAQPSQRAHISCLDWYWYFRKKRRDVLPFRSSEDVAFEDKVLMDRVCNLWRLTEFFVLRVAIKRLSVFSFLRVTTIAARHQVYVCLAMQKVKTLPCIGWYRVEFDLARDIFSKFPSSFLAKNSFASACSGLGKSYYSLKNT